MDGGCINLCHTSDFEDAANFDVSAIAPDSSIDYILEVDLEYPQHLHDQHTDLLFCPTRDKLPGKREDKLLATISSVTSFIIATCSSVLTSLRNKDSPGATIRSISMAP